MKSMIFWDMTPCSLLRCNRRFGGTQTTRRHIPEDDTVHTYLVHLRLGLSSGRFPSGFLTENFTSFPMSATCLVRFIILFELVILRLECDLPLPPIV
jgi:hypothetical protein